MSDFTLLCAGAVLATVGGALSDELRSMRIRSRERKAIKVSIADELGEIENTIGKQHEVWEKSKIFSPTYLEDLKGCTSAYDSLRQRMFLIKDAKLRKEIVDFYKKLKDNISKAANKVGTLDESTDAVNEQAGFDSNFQTICGELKLLKSKLD